jgi:hypothetical protein
MACMPDQHVKRVEDFRGKGNGIAIAQKDVLCGV